MKDKSLITVLKTLSDETLDGVINDVLPRQSNSDIGVCMQFATLEWRNRYPGTIAPCIFKRAKQKGGFPECYEGPRDTIDLATGVRISLQRIH